MGAHLGGTGSDNAVGIAIDSSGNLYITGHFTYTVDFDPGPDVLYLKTDYVSYPDIYLLKLLPTGLMY